MNTYMDTWMEGRREGLEKEYVNAISIFTSMIERFSVALEVSGVVLNGPLVRGVFVHLDQLRGNSSLPTLENGNDESGGGDGDGDGDGLSW